MHLETVFAKLRSLPSGNIADAMDQLNLRRGVILGLCPISDNQKKIVGIARTIKQMQKHQTTETVNAATHSTVIDSLSNDEVLVIDAGGRIDVCTGGAILALRAKQRGAAGYIVNGALRDKHEIIALDFPVYLKATTPIKSAPDLETVGIDIPVEISRVQVRPGDIIIADDTGIIVLPQIFAENVIEKAEQIQTWEKRLTEEIEHGLSFSSAIQNIKQTKSSQAMEEKK